MGMKNEKRKADIKDKGKKRGGRGEEREGSLEVQLKKGR